jgi:pilus assembly protein Flp/PilA
MRWLYDKGRELLRSEDGPTAVEYAVMLALIITVCFLAITALGQSVNNSFVSTNAGLS